MTDTTNTPDPRPAKCRFRLKDEGKFYPESTCDYCRKGLSTNLGNSCAITRPAPAVTVKPLSDAAVAHARSVIIDRSGGYWLPTNAVVFSILSAMQPEAPGAREAVLREVGKAFGETCTTHTEEVEAFYDRLYALIDQPAPAPQSLDERMKAAGMLTLTEILAEPVMGKFGTHAAMNNMEFFGTWLDRKRTEFLKMRMAYDLGDKPKDDDLWEWVFAHSATFCEVFDNFRAAGGLNLTAPQTDPETAVRNFAATIRNEWEAQGMEKMNAYLRKVADGGSVIPTPEPTVQEAARVLCEWIERLDGENDYGDTEAAWKVLRALSDTPAHSKPQG